MYSLKRPTYHPMAEALKRVHLALCTHQDNPNAIVKEAMKPFNAEYQLGIQSNNGHHKALNIDFSSPGKTIHYQKPQGPSYRALLNANRDHKALVLQSSGLGLSGLQDGVGLGHTQLEALAAEDFHLGNARSFQSRFYSETRGSFQKLRPR